MSRKYKFLNPSAAYFITYTVKDWRDVFDNENYRTILIDSLRFCIQSKGLELFAWCIMSNHVHLIARADGKWSLSDVIRDHKKYLARRILGDFKELDSIQLNGKSTLPFKKKKGFQFWEPESRPIELWSNKVIKQKLTYIHQNPVVSGLVTFPEDYPYSSATDYSGGKGILEVTVQDCNERWGSPLDHS